LGYSLAHVDLPFSLDHPPKDAPRVGRIAYLRLHGRNAQAWFDPKSGRDQRYDYLYPPAQLDELARVAQRLDEGADETFVITNNHFSGKAVANALELLARITGGRPLAPTELVVAFPRLGDLARTDGQGRMFW
jgi:uncharacterized protein YecE (DUF72 family)